MQCNIDSRGRMMRIVCGAVIESAGLLLIVLAAVGLIPPLWGYAIGGGLAFTGIVTVLQGILGWCMARAAGVKTPL